MHERLIDLPSSLLGINGLRVYSIEAWAEYTRAPPITTSRCIATTSAILSWCRLPNSRPSKVEMFLYLCDVPVELGPPSYAPTPLTAELPALPNWYPRRDGAGDDHEPRWVSATGRPDLYEHEVRATGPAGTVVAYRIETFHRGTALVAPLGARYTIHTSFRRRDAEWIGRRAWIESASTPQWPSFVTSASHRQLQLFGFPPPGHPFWNDRTAAGVRQRYPGFDADPWLRP